MIQKHLGFLLVIIAIGLFVPGILLTMFTLTMEMAVDVSGSSLASELVNKNLSIITTVEELWQQDRFLVSILIFAFSILIPIFKTLIVTAVYFIKRQELQIKLINFVAVIGKWSMADVFVVAVFLAVLSTNHAQSAEQQQLTFFGMKIGFEISTQTLSFVGQGFYFFVGYCVLSLLGTQIMFRGIQASAKAPEYSPS